MDRFSNGMGTMSQLNFRGASYAVLIVHYESTDQKVASEFTLGRCVAIPGGQGVLQVVKAPRTDINDPRVAGHDIA